MSPATAVASSEGQELLAVVARDLEIDDGAGCERRGEPDLQELLGAAGLRRFDQDPAHGTHLAVEMACQRRRALAAQPGGTLPDDGAGNLRHAGGGRAGPRREREDMEVGEAA